MFDTTGSLANAQLSLFANSFNSTPIETITLVQILDAIRMGRYQSKVDTLRRILAREGKSIYDQEKAYLPAVTFGGTFLPKRGNAYLQRHSGLIWGDMDNLDNIAATKRAICSDPRTVCLFTSPSAIGLKAGIHGPIVADDTAYKHAWNVVREEYERLYGVQWDSSGKDVSRLCYASYDPDLYVNFNAVCFDVPPVPPTPTSELWIYQKPQQSSNEATGYDPQRDVERAIRTAMQMIQAAPMGSRHHTRLKAAKLLGGYVGAGLLSETEAYDTLKYALEGHTEHLTAALKTVKDGLQYGRVTPFSLAELEADWQHWIDTHRPASPKTHQPPADDDPWDGRRTLPLKPYQGLRLGRTVRRG